VPRQIEETCLVIWYGLRLQQSAAGMAVSNWERELKQ